MEQICGVFLYLKKGWLSLASGLETEEVADRMLRDRKGVHSLSITWKGWRETNVLWILSLHLRLPQEDGSRVVIQ